jgi:hypothetical protein
LLFSLLFFALLVAFLCVLGTHLAELLFAARRGRDRFETRAGPWNAKPRQHKRRRRPKAAFVTGEGSVLLNNPRTRRHFPASTQNPDTDKRVEAALRDWTSLRLRTTISLDTHRLFSAVTNVTFKHSNQTYSESIQPSSGV